MAGRTEIQHGPKHGTGGAAEVRAGTGSGRPDRSHAHWPVIQFLLVFGLLMAAFYAVFYMPPSRYPRVGEVFAAFLSFYAHLAGAVLRFLGEPVIVVGQSISSSRFAVEVVRGCDAMEATAVLVAAMLASPVPALRKVPGIIGGVLLLGLVNLVRIVSLFFVGIHWPSWFDTLHFQVWQPVFILLAVGGWLMWALWARRPRPRMKAATRVQDRLDG